MKIGCVLVLFNPDISLLKSSIDRLYNQVDLIFLSDNSSKEFDISIIEEYGGKCLYQKMNGNIGIAAAQNYGIKYFIDQSYDYVIFMDQDSIAPENLLGCLLHDLEYLKKLNVKVGGIGPRPVNRQTEKDYRGIFKKGHPFSDNITEVVSLISSATLVPIECFKDVGLLESQLFIDGVDHEWCWRGRDLKGLRFFISEKAKLSHQLGEGDKNLLGVNIAISTPFRSFYQYRNYFILVRRKYVPFYWKFMNGVKYLIKYFYYPLCVSPRFEHFKGINKGIYSGVFFREQNKKRDII